MKRPRRALRAAVLALLVIVAGAAGLSGPLIGLLGGAFSGRPEDLASLSPAARALVDRAFADVEPGRLFDYHTHVAGMGAGGTGCTIGPRMLSWLHPADRLKFKLYMSAAAIEDESALDRLYVERLTALVRGFPEHGRHGLLAFDRHHRSDGAADPARTGFFVPNDYVIALAGAHPDLYRPIASVHPYRDDAIAELQRVAGLGARIVKWLPSAQGIDPADPRCDAFYDEMRELGLVLLAHAGEEQAVHAEDAAQLLGNPLKLRRPLDRGVRVVVAHAASLGTDIDLDDPEGRSRPSFELFLRLMDDRKYEKLLFADLSGVTQFNRLPSGALGALLRRKDLHPRLVNGSDYPLPGINALVRTRTLVVEGYLTADERQALNEVYDRNPLLFDYVLKRTVRAPGTGERFPPAAFLENPGLD